MISLTCTKNVMKSKSFRLLNSEIGNDQIEEIENLRKKRRSFRLLNSEIGNDPIKYQNGIRMGFTSIK